MTIWLQRPQRYFEIGTNAGVSDSKSSSGDKMIDEKDGWDMKNEAPTK